MFCKCRKSAFFSILPDIDFINAKVITPLGMRLPKGKKNREVSPGKEERSFSLV